MKKYLILLLCLACIKVNAQDASNIKPNLQEKYLIKELKNYYICFPNFDLEKMKKEVDKEINKPSSVIKSIDVQYTDSKEIYEFIIEYKPSFDVKKMMLKKYGEPNDDTSFDEGWKFKLSDGLELKIWQYQNKLCIANANQF